MTPNSPNPTKFLAPFDDETQDFLRFVDGACQMALNDIQGRIREYELKGQEAEITDVTLAMMNMARAFGILFNRATDAGWVQAVHVEKEPEIIV